MKLIGKKKATAVVATAIEFDVFDAVDASNALGTLTKAINASSYKDDKGKGHQKMYVKIPLRLAEDMSMLLSKIAAPKDARNTTGLFDGALETTYKEEDE